MKKSIADMKAELEAEGYDLRSFVFSDTGDGIASPDKTIYFRGDKSDDLFQKAYAHLQEQRELAALRAFVLEINQHDTQGHVYDAHIADRAFSLAKQFNITDTSSP